MFLDILYMIFDSLEVVIDSLKVDLFTVGKIGINFWEIILGLLVLGIIFGFFLVPRSGSGLQGLGNIVGYSNRSSRPSRKPYREPGSNEPAIKG